MKQGKLIRRAVSAALAGCMMFTLSAPALAESTDALMQLSISGNRAASVLDAENSYGITVNGIEVTDENKDDILTGSNAGKLKYENGALCSDNVQLSGILRVTAPGTNIELNGGAYSPLATIYINGADNVTISSDKYSAIGNMADIDCTGKVTINALGDFGSYAVGARSRADEGTLIIRNASAVEINAPQYDQVIGGWKGIADITCNGPVTIRGNAKGGGALAKSFTYNRTDGADYVYFTSEDAETEAIEGSVTPIPTDAPYSYLHIEKKTVSAITVTDGIAKAGENEVTSAFNGQKVTVASTIEETADRKFDGWEVTKAPEGFTISADKLKQKEFSFIMPTGNVELTAHHSNRLEVSGGTAKVNGNAADFARPGADVTVTATDLSAKGHQFDHWEVSGGDIGRTGDDLKANPLNIKKMPDAAVKLTAVYRAAVKVSNGTAQVGTESGETVYALEGDTVTVTGHDSNASFSKFVGWKLKKGSLTTITDADGTSPNVTVDADKYLLDADGEKIKNETIKFTMPDEPVELSAVYSIPAIGLELPVIVEGGTINGTQDSFVRVRAGEKVTIKANTPDDENMQFCYWKVEEGTSEDFGVTVGKLGSETEPGTEDITFIMPQGAVKLTAQWSTTPDDTGTVDSGSDAGGAIAAVALGSAAVWGGYEVATRVILNKLLPEGAAIPANRGQLALLVWNNAGRPEPAAQPAFADVADADMAKAAQWCTEQGIMEAKSADTFKPEGWTPKFKVIETWNKAFPKAK
ncbi:MAG: InlB B-repeat-containing protein [Faecalibacterium sp.]